MKRMYVVLIIACVLFLRQLWLPGFPYTHDGENHLARIANYAVALRQGQFPPRWAPSFWAGYGYPVFNFNYPLLNIAAVPFLAVKVPVEITMKILISLAVVLSVLALWSVLNKRFSSFSAIPGVLVWLFAPFTYANLYVRGAVGEIAAYAAGLCVIWMVDLWTQRQTRLRTACVFISLLALLLAHNIISLILLPIILTCIMYCAWKMRALSRLLTLITLSLGASMFFWIPALAEKHLVNVDGSQAVLEYIKHLPTFDQLFSAPVQFGYSFVGPVDSMSFQIGLPFFVSFVLLLLSGFLLKKGARISAFVLSGASMVLFFMLSQYSAKVWESISMLKYLQFPWRLLGIATLLGAIGTTWVASKSTSLFRVLMISAVICMLIQSFHFPAPSRFTHDDVYYKTFTQTSTILDENRPKTLTVGSVELQTTMPHLEDGVIYLPILWNGSHHIYEVKSDRPHQIIEPTAYFPGWKVFVDKKEVRIEYELADGLIAFQVEPGEHRIETRITQDTFPRILGNLISLVSLSAGTYVLLRWRKT